MASSDFCCHCGDMVPVDVVRDCDGTGFVCKVCGSSTDYVFNDDDRDWNTDAALHPKGTIDE
jgi:hypothetical protein